MNASSIDRTLEIHSRINWRNLEMIELSVGTEIEYKFVLYFGRN